MQKRSCAYLSACQRTPQVKINPESSTMAHLKALVLLSDIKPLERINESSKSGPYCTCWRS